MSDAIDSVVEASDGEIFDIELEENLLEENRKLADQNHKLLRENGVIAIDIMGSIGAGKTTLIENLVKILTNRYNIAAFKGDLTTTIDAEIIGRHGVDVVAINTGKECHLDANLIRKALLRLDLKKIDLLFIENVGNLICPAEFPLGADKRLVVVSVTEGPYMIVKHPLIFIDAHVVAVNKTDLAEAMNVDLNQLKNDVKNINPDAHVVFTNARTGEGVEEIVQALGI